MQAALNTSNVVVTTGGTGSPGSQTGDIQLDIGANLTWSNANSLTLSAFRDITLLQGSQITNTGCAAT